MEDTLITNCTLSGRFINCHLNVLFQYVEMWLCTFENCITVCEIWGCYYPYIEKNKIGTFYTHQITNKEFNEMTRE